MVTVLHLFNVKPVRRFGILSYFGGYPFSFSSSIPLSLKVLLTPAPLLHPLQDVAYLFYTHFIPIAISFHPNPSDQHSILGQGK